ncbi:MAG: bifunctional riboflavin kinase/FAD synthetase, partial [Arenimonas sp.]
RDLGADIVGLLRFDARMTALEPEQFVRDVLVGRLSAREAWAGPDFRFGKGRRGDFAMLAAEGAKLGLQACTIEPVVVDGERVSSSRVRLQLAAGDLDAAAHALGHRYALSGHVVYGKQLGRKLGYPTANLRFAGKRPALGGIFACFVHGVGPTPRPGVASLGTRPTVFGTEPLLEAHLFDFDGDLYGQRIAVEFVAKLRDEEKFNDLPALVRQMDVDARQARKLLRQEPGAVA